VLDPLIQTESWFSSRLSYDTLQLDHTQQEEFLMAKTQSKDKPPKESALS
jgi:hypothetical protein